MAEEVTDHVERDSALQQVHSLGMYASYLVLEIVATRIQVSFGLSEPI